MTETRTRIAVEIRNDPGIHFNGLLRALGLGTGQAQYHLKKLCDTGDCETQELYGRTHYYPPGYTEWERGALALLQRETANDIVRTLFETGPTKPAVLAERVDIARSTLAWHVDRLVERDVLRKQYDTQNRVTLSLTHPSTTAELLNSPAVTPSTTERLLDRYMRLADHLLD